MAKSNISITFQDRIVPLQKKHLAQMDDVTDIKQMTDGIIHGFVNYRKEKVALIEYDNDYFLLKLTHLAFVQYTRSIDFEEFSVNVHNVKFKTDKEANAWLDAYKVAYAKALEFHIWY